MKENSILSQHYITVPCLKNVFFASINIYLFIFYLSKDDGPTNDGGADDPTAEGADHPRQDDQEDGAKDDGKGGGEIGGQGGGYAQVGSSQPLPEELNRRRGKGAYKMD